MCICIVWVCMRIVHLYCVGVHAYCASVLCGCACAPSPMRVCLSAWYTGIGMGTYSKGHPCVCVCEYGRPPPGLWDGQRRRRRGEGGGEGGMVGGRAGRMDGWMDGWWVGGRQLINFPPPIPPPPLPPPLTPLLLLFQRSNSETRTARASTCPSVRDRPLARLPPSRPSASVCVCVCVCVCVRVCMCG